MWGKVALFERILCIDEVRTTRREVNTASVAIVQNFQRTIHAANASEHVTAPSIDVVRLCHAQVVEMGGTARSVRQ